MEIAVVICASRRQKRLLTKFPAKIDADLVNNFNGAESHQGCSLPRQTKITSSVDSGHPVGKPGAMTNLGSIMPF
jgi:hypothetical protein